MTCLPAQSLSMTAPHCTMYIRMKAQLAALPVHEMCILQLNSSVSQDCHCSEYPVSLESIYNRHLLTVFQAQRDRLKLRYNC